jgi:hypothetical protein
MRRRFLPLLVALLFFWVPLLAKDQQVKGYKRKDGTVVSPYKRSAPNRTKSDNYSTKGNVNPHTGKPGTKIDRGSSTPYFPSSTSVAPTTSLQPSKTSGPPATQQATVKLSLVRIGMKKSEVIAAVGEPNMKSSGRWLYSESGLVKFKDDVVSSVEAK